MEHCCLKEISEILNQTLLQVTMNNENKEHAEISVESYQTTNNVNASDLDEETNNKLKGDAIGDTLYSQSFVLRTLLKFSDLKWNEEIEEDLCFLWDMTVEKDVCKYLFEISFPSLACDALIKYTENRFVEIIIGILGNILCADCEKNITQEEICIVLRELDTDDPLILIQLSRFLSAIAHIFEELPFITQSIMNKIQFILCNTTNKDLLLKTLEAMGKLTSNYKLNTNLINMEIINSCITAYRSVVDNDNFELENRDEQLMCRYMLQTVSNVCSYVDRYENSELLLEFKKCSNIFINEVINVLTYYSNEENLLPITDDFIYYMSVFRFVLGILNVNYLSSISLPLCKILIIILDIEEVTELCDTTLELLSFLISHGCPELVYEDLKHLRKNMVKTILNAVNKNKHKFDFDVNVQYLLNEFK